MGKSCNCSQNEIVNSKGEVVILATRVTWNINGDLPYALWGALYIDSPNSFGRVLQPYLPTGVSVAVSIINTGANAGSLLFTYTKLLLVDTIIVKTPTGYFIAYPEIVSSTKTYYMKSNLMMFNCNAADIAPTLTNDKINVLLNGAFILQRVSALSNVGGQRNQEIIIPRSRQMINNTVFNLREIYLRKEPIKPDTVWVHKFNYITGLETTIQFSITVFASDIYNANCEPERAIREKENLNYQVPCS